MARLDAKWYNFWGDGQTWYHFWQDTSGTNHELSLSDSVTLSEENIKSVVLLNEDSVTLSDSSISSVSFTLADVVTLSDIQSTSVSIFENDNVTLSDEIQLQPVNYELSLSDLVTLSDVFSHRKTQQSARGGGYIRFTEVVDKKKEQAKREDEILLMVIKGFIENL